MPQSPPTFTPISNNSGAMRWGRCLCPRTGRGGLPWLKWVKCKARGSPRASRVSVRWVNVGLSAHSKFPPLPDLQAPALPRCLGVRNEEAKGTERLSGVIKGSSELETKAHQDEPCFTCLFIQTLKYMT